MMKEITLDMIRDAWHSGALGIRGGNNCISVVWGFEWQDTCLIHPMYTNIHLNVSEYMTAKQIKTGNNTDNTELYKDILRSLGRTVADRSVKMTEDLWNTWYEVLSSNKGASDYLPIYDGT